LQLNQKCILYLLQLYFFQTQVEFICRLSAHYKTFFALTKAYLIRIKVGLPFAFSDSERLKNPFTSYMKKQILLLISITISTLTIAQLKPSFGVRGGVSSANMRGDAVNSLGNILDFANGMITTGNRTGFFAGGYAAIPLSDVMSVEPALYYSQKGYELKGGLNVKGLSFLGANAKAKLNAQYIDLPVLLKANINGFQVFAGPQVSYLMNADVRTTAGVFGVNLLNTKISATSQFSNWDAGVTGGVGYQFTNGMNAMASYDYGLTRVDANRSLNSYNRSFKVGIGMSF